MRCAIIPLTFNRNRSLCEKQNSFIRICKSNDAWMPMSCTPMPYAYVCQCLCYIDGVCAYHCLCLSSLIKWMSSFINATLSWHLSFAKTPAFQGNSSFAMLMYGNACNCTFCVGAAALAFELFPSYKSWKCWPLCAQVCSHWMKCEKSANVCTNERKMGNESVGLLFYVKAGSFE